VITDAYNNADDSCYDKGGGGGGGGGGIMTKFFLKALFWQILSVACIIGIIFEVFN
jgi:hypothetical protein